MGILTALDFHSKLEVGASEKCAEVEYCLYSWGEIFQPFCGNREHSIGARFILDKSPFKLFASSTPYQDTLPQKLSVTFKAPREERSNSEHVRLGGTFPHEIAHEFAAFLSVVTRRRVFASKQVRYDGLPIEQESGVYVDSRYQERQRLKEIDPDQILQLLRNLKLMDREVAYGFVLALRLYHAAVQMMYTEPEFSYIFLVTCLEAVSSVTHKNFRPAKLSKFLDDRYPGWRDFAKLLPEEKQSDFGELLLRNERYSFRKLVAFVQEFLPESFWSDTEDDAKPDNLVTVLEVGPDGQGQERIVRSSVALEDYEKIAKEDLEKTLRRVYDARSKLVHQGVRFPASIVLGHYRNIPIAAHAELMEIVQKQPNSPYLPIPPLLTFERLVSLSLVNYLIKQQ